VNLILDEERFYEFPWHFLYFFSLPQGHFSLRPTLPYLFLISFFSVQDTQVQASGCSLYQLARGKFN